MPARLNVISSLGAGAWAALVGIMVLPAYLRFLGMESFGLVGFILTLQGWFLLLDLGLSPTASREMARFSGGRYSAQEIRDLFASLERVYLLIALVLGCALIAGSGWIARDWLQLRSLDVDSAARSLALMSGMVAAQWMATLYRSALNGLQRQVWLGGFTVLMVAARALVTLATLAWFSPRLEAFVLAQGICYAVETIGLRAYLGRRLPRLRGRFDAAALRQVWRFAAGLTAITAVATVLNQLDKLLLARLLPLEEFGHVSLAMTVVGALSIVVTPVFNAAYPRLSELVAAGAGDEIAREYHVLSEITSVILLPVAVTLFLLAPQAVYAWTGDRHVSSVVAPLISAWIIGTALNGIMHVPYALQLANGWVRLSLTLNICAAAAIVPAIVVLVPRHGAIAAGWVWAAVNFFYFTVGTALMHVRILPHEWVRWYVRDVGLPLGAAVMAGGIWAAIMASLGPLDRIASGAGVAGGLLVTASATLAVSQAGRKLLRAALERSRSRALLRQ